LEGALRKGKEGYTSHDDLLKKARDVEAAGEHDFLTLKDDGMKPCREGKVRDSGESPSPSWPKRKNQLGGEKKHILLDGLLESVSQEKTKKKKNCTALSRRVMGVSAEKKGRQKRKAFDHTYKGKTKPLYDVGRLAGRAH